MKFSIRKAASPDFETIMSIDTKSVDDASRRRFIRRAIDDGICFLGTIGEEPVAYMIFDHSFFESGFISLVYVKENFRRRSFATVLIDHAESTCRTEKIFTSTNQSNMPMQMLLPKRGYEPSGTIYNLDEGDPELVFYKRLGNR